MNRTISLDPEQIRALERMAAEDDISVAELLLRAVDFYIAHRLTIDERGQERLADFLARVRANVPEADAEQIEADITAAREEVRQRRASRGR